MKIKPMPSREYLFSRLHYDLSTGDFRWKPQHAVTPEERRWNSRYAEKVAGSVTANGYLTIAIDGVVYYGHRLAWVILNGDNLGTDDRVDHRDRAKLANDAENLRKATHGQNISNSALRKGKMLPKGVSVHVSGRFISRIGVDRRVVYLGLFDSPEAAHAAYQVAAVQFKGEFARFE